MKNIKTLNRHTGYAVNEACSSCPFKWKSLLKYRRAKTAQYTITPSIMQNIYTAFVI